MLKTLEYASDELTSANLTAQTLLTEFGLECENCELDGIEPPTEFDEAERKSLRSAITSAKAALRYLEALEAQHGL